MTGGCRVESKFFGMGDVSRGKHEDSVRRGAPRVESGCRSAVGYEAGRDGAKSARRRKGVRGVRGMADHARSIYQNTPATRAHIYTCTRARARARVHTVHPRTPSIYALTYANCKYNLSGTPRVLATAWMCTYGL